LFAIANPTINQLLYIVGATAAAEEPLDITFARWVRRYPWLHERILCAQVVQFDEIVGLLKEDETAPKWNLKELVRVLEAQVPWPFLRHERCLAFPHPMHFGSAQSGSGLSKVRKNAKKGEECGAQKKKGSVEGFE